MARLRIPIPTIGLLLCIVTGLGCSTSPSATGPSTSADVGSLDRCIVDRQPDDPEQSGDGQVHDYVQGAPAFQDLVTQSDIAIVGIVEEVGNARWNSESGEQWCSASQGPKVEKTEQRIHAFRYRPVVVRITEVLFDRANSLRAGENVSLVFPPPGGSSNSWELADRVTVTVETRNAPPLVGSRVVQLADRKPLDFERGSRESFSADTGSLGWWVITNDLAKSEIPGRTVELDALRKRILDLRDAGPVVTNNEATEKSRINPLA